MSDQSSSSLTARLARLLGILPEYEDAWYQIRQVPIKSQEAVIQAMGHPDIAASLVEAEKRPWNLLIEPVIVIPEEKQPADIPIYFPLAKNDTDRTSIMFTLVRESGEILSGTVDDIACSDEKTIDDIRYVRVDILLDSKLENGYHTFEVKVVLPEDEMKGTTRLIVAPDQCLMPEKKTWGITLSLYSLRSEDDWGIGDLGCLKRFIVYAQNELRAGFVGISPLHAIANKGTAGISPYFPISRLYHNFIYIDLPLLLKASQEGKAFLELQSTKDEVAKLRAAQFVDYEDVAALKRQALQVAWDAFKKHHIEAKTPVAEEFDNYIEGQGKHLKLFSTFMALGDRLGYDSRHEEWSLYRDPASEAVEKFSIEHADDIRFHQFVQWVLDRQLAEIARLSSEMDIGLYFDLAVGSAPAGSDAWANPSVFVQGVDVGAPPDAFNSSGQNWGFPPLSTEALRKTAFDTFTQTIRHNLRHAGALRIDHALGLFRLFWIPEEVSASEGAYVKYPYKDLLRIVALESVRQRCVIIAEDLGTVGDEVHEALYEHGMLSYRLLYFERDRHTRVFHPPEKYPELALAAANTHDLPTLKGFWSMHDIDTRAALGMYSSKDDERAARKARAETLNGIEEILLSALPESRISTWNERLTTVCRFLAGTSSKLVSVSLDDALGLLEQQNLPGVVEGHPNWKRRYPMGVEQMEGYKLLHELAELFNENGRGVKKA